MEYLKREKDLIIKYDVNIEKEKLLKLRKTIIKKCGVRKHKIIETDYPRFDILFYENYTKEKIGEKEYFEETRDVYREEFDLISEPKLAKLINLLVEKEDLSLLDYLYNGKELDYQVTDDDYKITRKEIVNKINHQLSNSTDYNVLKGLINELEVLDRTSKVGDIKLESQKDYIEETKQLIHLTKIDLIQYDEYERVMNFVKTLKK